ncbi:acyl-CoA dehydrogenase family protein [Natronomonas sp.]|uniref:acyl-CoA dehydrogenase family protein n=1 Tax=Natronomonas sp. TaxID=2184060 RepID=UPI002FC2A13C
MKYDDSERATEIADRTRQFVSEVVVPVERELRSETEIPDEQLAELREKAREYGVFGPGIPEQYGGLGLSFREQVPVLEAAGRSRLGPHAVHAPGWPDEAALYALEAFGSNEQRDRWLEPLVEGEIKAAVSMTEPTSGAGSDPTMIGTTAEKDGDEWVIDGHKWWATQGGDADLIILFAKTDSEANLHEGISVFAVPMDTPGVTVERDIAHMSDHVVGEPVHSEITFDDVHVPESALMGEEGEGFVAFQKALNHSRVWLGLTKIGMAERALDVAKAYASERESFDEKLVEKQALRFDLAEAQTKLHAVRLLGRDVTRKMTAGEPHRTDVAMFKYRSSNVTQDVIDRAVQTCGANGIGEDLPLSDFYTNIRAFRIYDGPDATHQKLIARELFRDIDSSEVDAISRFGDPNTWPSE